MKTQIRNKLDIQGFKLAAMLDGFVRDCLMIKVFDNIINYGVSGSECHIDLTYVDR